MPRLGDLLRLSALALFGLIQSCTAGCYFPAELQGQFVMQLQFQGTQALAQAGIGHVQYSQVNISSDNIPIWGRCHRRIGNNVILLDSSGSANCTRCFHLKLVARNVLQVHTEELSKCYTTEEAAMRTCPDETTLKTRSKEILLYKTKELDGEEVLKEYCPVSGRFTFTYNVNDGLENKQECPTPDSELDNCPAGNAMNVRFRGCSFENHNITFECLGHWTGTDNQRYLALLDTRVDAVRRAQYRCAMYREDEATGMTYIAFSSDSTCSTDLHSATQGYETLTLRKVPTAPWPRRVETAACRFPSWAQGRWEHVTVGHNSLTYRDHAELKTFSLRCIGPDQGESSERVPVYYRTQCGHEKYTCVWLKHHGSNVLEFQIGLQESDRFNNSLCSLSNFREKIWVTQGRTDRVQESPCPITGEYNGLIPDADGLCAKLSSDCANPDVMYYTVSDCGDEVYEDRSQSRYPRPRSRQRRDAEAAADDAAVGRQALLQDAAAAETAAAAPQLGQVAPSTASATAASRIYRISSSPRQTSAAPGDQQQEASWASVSNRSTSTWGQRTDSTLVAYSLPHAVPHAVPLPHTNPNPQPRHASAHGPMYPSSYNALLNLTTSTAAPASTTSTTVASRSGSAPAAFSEEEEYDPWAFPKMHGLQTTSPGPRVADAMHARPVMYFNSQSGYRDPVREAPPQQQQPNPFYYHGPAMEPPPPASSPLPALPAAREVSIGWPGARASAMPPSPAADLTATSTAGMGSAGMGTGTAMGGTYRGRPVEIPGLPPSPFLESRSGTGFRMRIVPMAVPVHGVMALSARAPTDRGMEFGERGALSSGVYSIQERSSTPRRALQPHDSGWTLEGGSQGTAFRPVAAPRTEARSAATPFRMEERQYRCLGQWQEGKLLYTYTQRKDVGTYECFVGSKISPTEIYIKEAGEHCERDANPLERGMLLHRKDACVGSVPVPPPAPSSPTPRPRPTTQWSVTRRPVETHTKPWKPITAPPRPKLPVQSTASALQSSALCFLSCILIILLKQL